MINGRSLTDYISNREGRGQSEGANQARHDHFRLNIFLQAEPGLKAEVTQITACSLAGPIFTQLEHSCYMNLYTQTVASIRYLEIPDIMQ